MKGKWLLVHLVCVFMLGVVPAFAQEDPVEDQVTQESIETPEPTVPDETGVPVVQDESAAQTEEDQAAKAEQAKQSKQAAKAAAAAPGASGIGTETAGFLTAPVPDTSVFTGAASYRIPIRVPSGRNGLTPSIALTYNSMRANSWVGVGWDLSLGSIRHSTKRGLDYMTDDFVVEENGSSKELISATTTWGANFYRVKIDEEFGKYFRNPTTKGWEVTAKDGTKYFYGSTGASRYGTSFYLFEWCLDKIVDTNGNYISITYTKIEGRIYPLEIKYTGHVSPSLAPGHSIKFILEERDDMTVDYATTVKIKNTKRLSAVEIYTGTDLVRRYDINHSYSPTTNRTLVKSITQYGSDGTTHLPATSFIHQTSADPGTFGDPIRQDGDSFLSYMADINGDGLSDLVSYEATNKQYENDELSFKYRLSLGNGTFGALVEKTINLGKIFDYKAKMVEECGESESATGGSRTVCHNVATNEIDPEYALKPVMGDINSDGKLDLIVGGKADYNTARLAICLGQGNGNFNAPTLQDGDSFLSNMADVNGDGLSDLVSYEATNKQYENDELSFKYRLSLGNGTFGALVEKTINLGKIFDYKAQRECEQFDDPHPHTVCHDTLEVDPEYALKPVMGDINGDGKLDVIVNGKADYNTPRMAVCLSMGNGNFDTPVILDGISFYPGLIDVNADGLDDLISCEASNKVRPFGNDELKFEYRLSLGDGQFGPLVTKTITLSNSSSSNPATANPFYGEWGGGGFPYPYGNNQNSEYNLQTQIGDINGDGKLDVIIGGMVDYNTARIVTLLTSGPYPDLLSGVTNTLGGSASLTYQCSTAYENKALPFPVQTVSSITTNDGLSNANTTGYTYSGGYYVPAEREFRGFETAVKTNPNGTKETTWFHQTKFYQGKPKRMELRAPGSGFGGVLLSGTTLTWSVKYFDEDHTSGFVKLASKMTESYDAETVFSKERYYYDADRTTNPVPVAQWAANLEKTVITGTGAEQITKEYEYQNIGDWTWRTTKETLKNSQGTVVRQKTDDWQPVTGNLLSSTAWLENGDSPVLQFEYDAYGNVTHARDGRGYLTETVYDTTTNTYPIKIIRPQTGDSQHITEYEWNMLYGRLSKAIDENNQATLYSYDPLGRLKQIDYPDNGQQAYFYYDTASPRYIYAKTKENDTYYVPRYDYYDGFGRSVQTTTFGEYVNDQRKRIITRTRYDNMDRVERVEGPFFAPSYIYGQEPPATGYPFTQTTYDLRNRPIKLVSPHGDYSSGVTTVIGYSGFSTTVTDPDGVKKKEIRDHLGRIVEVVEYNGTTEYHTSYDYNAAGDLTLVTDTYGKTTTLAYDTLGRKTGMIDPDMGQWTYVYDKNSNLSKQTDAKGQLIGYAYDKLNRPLYKYYKKDDVKIAPTVYYYYDNPNQTANGMGRPFSVVESGVTQVLYDTYDEMGRNTKLTKTIDGTGYTTQTEYDLSGKVKKITYPDDYYVTYVYYPSSNLIKSVTGSDNAVHAFYTDYEPSGKIGQVTHANGIATRYTYDAKSTRIFGIVTEDPSKPAGTPLQDKSYTYTKAGDVKEIADHNKNVTYTYTYDKLHRLLTERGGPEGIAYTYDAKGRILTRKIGDKLFTYNYANSDHIHAVSSIVYNRNTYNFEYDFNGNMTSSPDLTDPDQVVNRTVTYDMDNMPVQISRGLGKGGVLVFFTYDGTGKRIKKTVSGGKTVLYLGDHYEVENGVGIKYIFGGNLRLAQIKGSLTSYFHKDHLGSTGAITDQNGVKQEGAEYQPFGTMREHTGANVSAYKFTDQELDNETNLYNYDARLYDPVLGMFVTPDSIVPNMFDPQTLNRYAYCRNNPLIYVDPTGHAHDIEGTDVNAGDKQHGKDLNEKAEQNAREAADRNPDSNWATDARVIKGSLVVTGETVLVGPVVIEGELVNYGNLTTNGMLTVNGGVVNYGNITTNGDTTVNGNVVNAGNITTNGSTMVDGDVFNGKNCNITTNGDTTVTGQKIDLNKQDNGISWGEFADRCSIAGLFLALGLLFF